MSDSQNISHNPASLLGLARELEGRMARMTAELSDMRGTVQVLTQHLEAQAQAAYLADPEHIEVSAEQAPVAPPPVESAPEPSPRPTRVPIHAEPALGSFDTWGNVEHGLWPEPQSHREQQEGREAPEEVVAEQAAEEVSAELVAAPVEEAPPEAPEVEALELSAEEEPQTETEAEEEEDPREAVRRAVEEARAEMSGGVTENRGFESWTGPAQTSQWSQPAPQPEPTPAVNEARQQEGAQDEEDPREAVRRMVEQARAELAGSATNTAPNVEDAEMDAGEAEEEDPREAVRRAVEASRAELGLDTATRGVSGGSFDHFAVRIGEEGKPASERFARIEAMANPSLIVIEDPEGRVELVQVYRTLGMVEKASQAALLNYTPHSVTVGLNNLAEPPGLEELAAAAESVFGRTCRASSDGTRISVVVGGVKAA